MNYLLSILVGVFSSLAVFVVLVFVVGRLRPRIEISRQIAKRQDWKGNAVYNIKIINRTPRPVIDIKARLHLLTPSVSPDGLPYKTIEVPLKRSSPIEIAAFDKNDREAKYSYRFTSYKDIDSLWRDHDDSQMRFRLFAVDSVSGLGRVFTQDFPAKRDALVEGDFIMGDSMEIKCGEQAREQAARRVVGVR